MGGGSSTLCSNGLERKGISGFGRRGGRRQRHGQSGASKEREEHGLKNFIVNKPLKEQF